MFEHLVTGWFDNSAPCVRCVLPVTSTRLSGLVVMKRVDGQREQVMPDRIDPTAAPATITPAERGWCSKKRRRVSVSRLSQCHGRGHVPEGGGSDTPRPQGVLVDQRGRQEPARDLDCVLRTWALVFGTPTSSGRPFWPEPSFRSGSLNLLGKRTHPALANPVTGTESHTEAACVLRCTASLA